MSHSGTPISHICLSSIKKKKKKASLVNSEFSQEKEFNRVTQTSKKPVYS